MRGIRACEQDAAINSTLEKLERLGLSSYEAKAVLALLKKHLANGYQVGKIARLKSSYDTAIHELENDLKLITPIPELDLSWNLMGYHAVRRAGRDSAHGSWWSWRIRKKW